MVNCQGTESIEGRSFLVDYVDGDTEDEFKWLEGPHSQEHTTIADLLERGRAQSRKDRRRQGHTECRCDEDLDLKDPHGKRLAAEKPKQATKKGLRKLLEEYSEGEKATKKGLRKLLEEYSEDENEDNKLDSNAIARKEYLERLENFVKDFHPKDRVRVKDILEGEATRRWNKEIKERDDGKGDGDHATLMVAKKDNQEAEPLHDLTYVGIDTCSARSISCDPKDFIDLQMLSMRNNNDQLRGVGGGRSVSGKGTLVFYAKDQDGKIEAIIEPRGFYIANPEAKISNLRATKDEKERVMFNSRLR